VTTTPAPARRGPVLVTGANGHVGYSLVKELIEHGYTVRASVRDPDDTKKTRPLHNLGAKVVRADVMAPETLRPAMDGVEGLFQVAAVFQFHAKDPQKEIIEPSVVGARNVLEAAHASGVKRVVFTSSTMAVGAEAPADRDLDERDWNDAAIEPYMIAKTRGERTAWEVAEKTGLDVVVVNPTSVIGPGFFRHTPSTLHFEAILRGQVPAIPPFYFAHVDARDVAVGHRLAYENTSAKGRYILADEHVTMRGLIEHIAAVAPSVKVPRFDIPRRLLPAAVVYDALLHRVRKRPRMLTHEMVVELGGKEQRVSSARARAELGWTARPYRESVADTVAWVTSRFL
jgi:dihydroflavonol-4-reductase